MSLKLLMKCLYCSKIFKDPISLPCGDTICEEHLKETNILKQNQIKCSQCNTSFEIKDNDFKSNTLVKKLLDEGTYMNDEEKILKLQLEEGLRQTCFESHLT